MSQARFTPSPWGFASRFPWSMCQRTVRGDMARAFAACCVDTHPDAPASPGSVAASLPRSPVAGAAGRSTGFSSTRGSLTSLQGLAPLVGCAYTSGSRLRIPPSAPPAFVTGTSGAPLHLGMRYRGRAVDVVFASDLRLGLLNARGGAAPSRPSDPWEGERRLPRA